MDTQKVMDTAKSLVAADKGGGDGRKHSDV